MQHPDNFTQQWQRQSGAVGHPAKWVPSFTGVKNVLSFYNVDKNLIKKYKNNLQTD